MGVVQDLAQVKGGGHRLGDLIEQGQLAQPGFGQDQVLEPCSSARRSARAKGAQQISVLTCRICPSAKTRETAPVTLLLIAQQRVDD